MMRFILGPGPIVMFQKTGLKKKKKGEVNQL